MKRKICSILLALVLVLSFSLLPMMVALAATPAPDLGDAESFAVLSGTHVTLTTSTVTGDVGAPLGQFTDTGSTYGTLHLGDGLYASANTSFNSAYDALAASSDNGTLLAGATFPLTLTPGDYYAPAGCTASNPTLTLNALGDPDAVWVFRIGTGGAGALAGTNFDVVFSGGVGEPRNVFWWVKDGATMTDSNFQGTILAGAAITFTGGTSIARAMAKAGVTIETLATFSIPPAAPAPPPPGPTPGPTVGGEAYPINKVNVLVPWLIPALIIVIGASVMVLRRRTSRQG